MAIQEYKSEINELQKIQLSMLKDFDAVCQRHRISYQLFSGTALGAVRHKGFIPWDDDIDVVVLREDYKRFFNSASKELDSNKYYVQRELSEHWPMFFSKLRLNGTTYIEKYHSHDARIHQGIYIDIFPCDCTVMPKFVSNSAALFTAAEKPLTILTRQASTLPITSRVRLSFQKAAHTIRTVRFRAE